MTLKKNQEIILDFKNKAMGNANIHSQYPARHHTTLYPQTQGSMYIYLQKLAFALRTVPAYIFCGLCKQCIASPDIYIYF